RARAGVGRRARSPARGPGVGRGAVGPPSGRSIRRRVAGAADVRRVLPLMVVLGLIAIGCGLPTDNAPRQIADDKVPFELLGPSTTKPPSNVGSTLVKLFFLDGEQLRAVD